MLRLERSSSNESGKGHLSYSSKSLAFLSSLLIIGRFPLPQLFPGYWSTSSSETSSILHFDHDSWARLSWSICFPAHFYPIPLLWLSFNCCTLSLPYWPLTHMPWISPTTVWFTVLFWIHILCGIYWITSATRSKLQRPFALHVF